MQPVVQERFELMPDPGPAMSNEDFLVHFRAGTHVASCLPLKFGSRLVERRQQAGKPLRRFPRVTVAEKEVDVLWRQGTL